MQTNTNTLTMPHCMIDLLKSARDNIISTAISTPVPGVATCYLCGDDESEAPMQKLLVIRIILMMS